jgi:hypothetical protein
MPNITACCQKPKTASLEIGEAIFVLIC